MTHKKLSKEDYEFIIEHMWKDRTSSFLAEKFGYTSSMIFTNTMIVKFGQCIPCSKHRKITPLCHVCQENIKIWKDKAMEIINKDDQVKSPNSYSRMSNKYEEFLKIMKDQYGEDLVNEVESISKRINFHGRSFDLCFKIILRLLIANKYSLMISFNTFILPPFEELEGYFGFDDRKLMSKIFRIKSEMMELDEYKELKTLNKESTLILKDIYNLWKNYPALEHEELNRLFYIMKDMSYFFPQINSGLTPVFIQRYFIFNYVNISQLELAAIFGISPPIIRTCLKEVGDNKEWTQHEIEFFKRLEGCKFLLSTIQNGGYLS